GDGNKRIDGTEVPLLNPWLEKGANHAPATPGAPAPAPAPAPAAPAPRPAGGRLKPVRKPGPAVTKPVARPAAAPTAAARGQGRTPEGIAAPRGGQADNLKEIEGIGPVLEKLCHELGIFHFDQIAAWGPDEIAWMDGNLKGFRGRITRDRWVAQAKLIV